MSGIDRPCLGITSGSIMGMSRGSVAVVLAALLYLAWVQWLRPWPTATQLPAGYHITELAAYGNDFRVLGRERYFFDAGATFAPLDLAVGWGVMADPKVTATIQVDQSNRWYRWRVEAFLISRQDIETHSANMHIVPANPMVAKQLKRIAVGDLVRLEGQLIEINGDNGWHWQSSLSREDTGDGACELMRVDRVIPLGSS
jgi:hypothetical protein